MRDSKITSLEKRHMSVFQIDFFFFLNLDVSFTDNLLFIFILKCNTVFLSLQCFQSHFNLCEKFAVNIQVEDDVLFSCVL